ncbi:MAG: hypothetical protein AAF708_14220 [Deinococcota bacterium]
MLKSVVVFVVYLLSSIVAVALDVSGPIVIDGFGMKHRFLDQLISLSNDMPLFFFLTFASVMLRAKSIFEFKFNIILYSILASFSIYIFFYNNHTHYENWVTDEAIYFYAPIFFPFWSAVAMAILAVFIPDFKAQEIQNGFGVTAFVLLLVILLPW